MSLFGGLRDKMESAHLRYPGGSPPGPDRTGLSEIRVFVTDGLWRKTLTAVRALGRQGIRVTVGESTYLAPSLFSRYCHGRVRTPSPVAQPARYVAFLEEFLGRHPHHVLLPMEEETLLLLARNRERFDQKTRFPFSGYRRLLFARDKLAVLRHAEALGIPTPRTFEITSPEAAMVMCGRLPFPLVVKPRVGSGSDGVQYVGNPDELIAAYRLLCQRGQVPLIQERLPANGPGIGASFLLDENHQVLASFVHRRLREYPVQGGPSTLRESILHEQARRDGTRLLQSIGMIGVAMVEFKVDDRDGQAKLLEVNPRFWGSLALAVQAGVNFPHLLTLMALGRSFPPALTYRVGHRCRWLLPGDILHFIHNPNRWRLEPSFFEFIRPDLGYDILDREDPLPILGTLLSLLPFYLSRSFAHVRGRRR